MVNTTRRNQRHTTGFQLVELSIIIMLGLIVPACSKPVRWSESSAEDILAGVDFLSVFMDTAERNYNHHITTYHPKFASTQDDEESSTIHKNVLIETKNEEPDTVTNRTEDEQVSTTVETSLLLDADNQEEIDNINITPSAIASNLRREELNVEESDPITIFNDNAVKVKRKSEDLLAIGANPDYLAQQHSRSTQNFNNPYQSRGRAVSYSAVIQVVPNQQINKTLKIPSTAESKDYFVTRKYNIGDFNDSQDKKIYQTTERNWVVPGKSYANPEIKTYATTERNWAVPEKSYGNPEIKTYATTERNWAVPEKNYANPEIKTYATAERNWGIPESTSANYGKPEQNYEVDESVSIITNGRSHGVQNSPPAGQVNEKPLHFKVGQTPVKPDDNQKIGYVVEGRNYRKYRVEERTPDGFIVGEYGVVSNNDGSLRGVRYTADGTINPRVIYDALMKFLAL